MTPRRPTGRQAVDQWSRRLDEVMDDPTDDRLQRLCGLLDAIDAWVVAGWGGRDHDERMAILSACRKDARAANRAVGRALRRSKGAGGRAALLARSAGPERLDGGSEVDGA
jgi:hypothetical protein